MVKWAAMHGLWWALNTLSSALWNATTLFTVTGIAVKMHWNDRCYFSYKHLKKCHNPLILQFKINPAMQKLQIGLSHTKKKQWKSSDQMHQIQLWLQHVRYRVVSRNLAPATSWQIWHTLVQAQWHDDLTYDEHWPCCLVCCEMPYWPWQAFCEIMCKNALKRQKTFQLKTDEKVPQSINTTVQDQSCCAEVLQISLSHKQWVSEYLLNGTSAQYRLFSAINGRTLEWFTLKAMNTT